MFTDLQKYGVNSARFWLHVDGRCSPTFDGNNVTGLPAKFYPDLDDFLDRAKNHNVGVLLTLWSADLLFTSKAYIDERPVRTGFVSDPAKTQTYIDNVLVPMAKRLDNRPEVIGYEVANELEFDTTEEQGGKVLQANESRDLLPLSAFQRFVAQQVVALHKNTSKLVNAVGSAAYKWSADKKPGTALGNWWSDDALRAQVSDADKSYAYNDAYQVHWYSWESGRAYNFSPWQANGPSFFNSGNKPVLIGEAGAADDIPKDDQASDPGILYTREQKLNLSYQQGYAGIFFWTYNGVDKFGGWNDIKDTLKAFHDAHASDIDLDLGGPVAVADTSPVQGATFMRSGSRAAALNPKGIFGNLWQDVKVNPRSRYTATIFIKGSGKVDLRLLAGSWGAEVANTRCAGTDDWQPCSVTVDTGDNTGLTFRLTDPEAGGTLSLDDASLDNGDGNVLKNTQFEDDSAWVVEKPFAFISQ